MIALALSFAAALGFLGAGFFVDTAFGRSRVFHHLSVVIAAGILLGVAFADLLPESFDALDTTYAALWIGVGFLALFLVEALMRAHTHHHEPHAHAHSHANAHAHSHAPVDEDGCVPAHAILPFLIGLALHNFTDGLVIGTSYEVSDSASTAVAAGILIHQIPVGLSFAAVLIASNVPHRRMRRNAALIGGMIVLGTLVVLAIPDLSDTTLGALTALSAGAVLYIAGGHLLPEAQSEYRHPGVAAAFVIALLGTIAFVGLFSDEHSHGADDDADHAAHADHASHDD
ncbi:MAG: ZIP family metal transporter [Thermoleophilia bacterium]|nr:ZIP family metal transporter [Thermoleophilia bacterium]